MTVVTPQCPAEPRSTPTGVTVASVTSPATASDDIVRRLLARRVTAFTAGDNDAWLATQAPSATTGRVELERLRAMRRLPVTDLAFTLESSIHRPGRSLARVRMSYRLGSVPLAEHRDEIEVLSTPGGWRLGGSHPVVTVDGGGTVPPWYLAGVTSRQTGAGGLVLLWPGTWAAGGDAVDLTVAGAAASQDAVPGAAAAGGPVVAFPDTAVSYRALVPGTGEAASGLAAVTADVPGPGGGDIVVVNPDVWPGLDAQERQVVLTHELVHVAVGAAIGDGQPLWLTEGYADHVALGPALLAGATRRQLAAHVFDGAGAPVPWIPDAGDFAADAAMAYPTSWLLVDHLARTYGEQAVLDLLALLVGAGQDAEVTMAEDRTMRQVLGVSRAQLIARWHADLAGSALDGAPR